MAPVDAEPNRKPRYPNVLRAFAETPWAILPSTLATMMEIVRLRVVEGVSFSAEELEERIGSGPATRSAAATGAVGVLPLYGVIFPKANMFTQYSGGTSLEQFREAFRALLGNDQIGSILIDVDSPGGSVSLVAETAAEIRAARGQKPIVAIANPLCASAAYEIACQADELVVSPSSLIGSIGVYATHDNLAEAFAMEGIERTLISAGKYKVDGNETEPLSEHAREQMQATVNDFYALFVNDVAKGRGVSAADVRSGFGEGDVVTAKNAVQLGMADRVGTFDETLSRMLSGKPIGAGARAAAELDPAPIEAAEPPKPDHQEHEEFLPEALELLTRPAVRAGLHVGASGP